MCRIGVEKRGKEGEGKREQKIQEIRNGERKYENEKNEEDEIY